MSRRCASCGAAIDRFVLAEASRPWRHVDVEDPRVSTCPGASLIGLDVLVRVDGDPESDAPWSTFLQVNLDAGLDLESIGDIEDALVACGHYVGHHDADVETVQHALEAHEAAELDRVDALARVVDDVRENPHDEDPDFFGSKVDASAERSHTEAMLEIANRARHAGEHALANLAVALMGPRS